jgi:hypothetical protein
MSQAQPNDYTESDLRQLTVRIPREIFSQIQDRANTNRRRLNAEIVCLLEEGLDSRVRMDLATLAAMRDRHEVQ